MCADDSTEETGLRQTSFLPLCQHESFLVKGIPLDRLNPILQRLELDRLHLGNLTRAERIGRSLEHLRHLLIVSISSANMVVPLLQ